MTFKGFGKDAIEFFDKLEANNDRVWFQANKATYQRACREPMEALLAELEPALGEGRIFRINRDTRFSADKSPYKTNIAAHVGDYYLSLSPEGLYVGTGLYMPEPPALARYREAVAADAPGRALEKIVGALEKKGYEAHSHDQLKSAPKGYTPEHPRIRFLRMKGIVMGRGWAPGTWLSTRKAFERIKTATSDLKPFTAWLAKHVAT
jgi:uncharacterized protein (TIGR02453 family)